MTKLLRYSIETDRTVLLSFTDESKVRVPLSRVNEYVAPNELRTIEKALLMRENFFKRHLPKFAISIVAGGLLVAGSFHENAVLNRLLQPPSKINTSPSAVQSKKDVLPVALPSKQAKPALPTTTEPSKISLPSSASTLIKPSSKPKRHAPFALHMPHIPKLLP